MYDSNSIKAWRWEKEVYSCQVFILYVKWYIIIEMVTVIKGAYYKHLK